MKTLTTTLLISFLTLSGLSLQSQPTLKNYWQVGIGLGEILMDGSFKPSITFGYHFSEKIYTGVIYQFKDQISRGASSFNAKSTELDGLLSSSETVSQRFMLQLRYTPVKFGPYLSTRVCF